MKPPTDPKAALIWITDILVKLQIPFQIAGGLAANAYGSKRKLHDIDIDIPEEAFNALAKEVKEFIIYGPSHFKDEAWDLMLMTLNYQGQLIDLSGAHETKIFDKISGRWQHLDTDFSAVEIKDVFGLPLPIIAFDELLSYKKILARDVDLLDIAALSENVK